MVFHLDAERKRNEQNKDIIVKVNVMVSSVGVRIVQIIDRGCTIKPYENYRTGE